MPKSNRRNQKNVWVDKSFQTFLKNIKAKKILQGEEIENLGQITEEMMKVPAIKEVEQQLLLKKEMNNLQLKMDKRRGLF